MTIFSVQVSAYVAGGKQQLAIASAVFESEAQVWINLYFQLKIE